MACFLLFTVFPLRPLLSFPCFIAFISVSTLFPAAGEYFRVDFFFPLVLLLRRFGSHRITSIHQMATRFRRLSLRSRSSISPSAVTQGLRYNLVIRAHSKSAQCARQQIVGDSPGSTSISSTGNTMLCGRRTRRLAKSPRSAAPDASHAGQRTHSAGWAVSQQRIVMPVDERNGLGQHQRLHRQRISWRNAHRDKPLPCAPRI